MQNKILVVKFTVFPTNKAVFMALKLQGSLTLDVFELVLETDFLEKTNLQTRRR